MWYEITEHSVRKAFEVYFTTEMGHKELAWLSRIAPNCTRDERDRRYDRVEIFSVVMRIALVLEQHALVIFANPH